MCAPGRSRRPARASSPARRPPAAASRCRIVRERTPSTSPCALHHSGRCRGSSTRTGQPSSEARASTCCLHVRHAAPPLRPPHLGVSTIVGIYAGSSAAEPKPPSAPVLASGRQPATLSIRGRRDDRSCRPHAAVPRRRRRRRCSFAPGSPERARDRGRARRGPGDRLGRRQRHRRPGRAHRAARPDRHAARAQGAAGHRALGRRGRDAAGHRRGAGRGDVVGAPAVGGAGRAVPARGRHARARPVARAAQRRDHARAVEDDLPGRHRRRLRDARLHPRQRQEHARHVRRAADVAAGEWNSAEYRPLEGFVFAVTPVQLHLHEQPGLRPGRARQHRRVEAGRERVAGGAPVAAAAARGRPARRRDQRRLRRRRRDRRRRAEPPRSRRRALHRLDRHVPAHLAHGRRERRQLQELPAGRRRDRRQGLHRRPPRRPTSTRSPRRASAARTSTRDRSARPPRGCTRRAACGRRCASGSSSSPRRSSSATPPRPRPTSAP